MNLERAQLLAKELCDAIAPFCAPGQCVIAGSVRRKKPDPHDVEIVALPVLSDYDKVDGLRKLLASNRLGRVKKGQFPGRQIVLNDGHCDKELYFQSRESYGLNLFIRTGSAKFVADALAHWKKITNGGYSEGAILHLADGTPVPTLTEEAVFEALKCKWIPPEKRDRE